MEWKNSKLRSARKHVSKEHHKSTKANPYNPQANPYNPQANPCSSQASTSGNLKFCLQWQWIFKK